MPIPILSLLYKCWEHDPSDRPSSTEIHAFARLPEFPRLFDDLGEFVPQQGTIINHRYS